MVAAGVELVDVVAGFCGSCGSSGMARRVYEPFAARGEAVAPASELERHPNAHAGAVNEPLPTHMAWAWPRPWSVDT